MFASLVAEIRRLPLWGQAIAWPLFGIFWLVCQIVTAFLRLVGWMLTEMFGRAKAGAKKTFAPLLWPAVAVFAFLGLAAALGPNGMQQLIGQVLAPLLAIVIMLFGLRVMVFGWPKPKKKKK
jgi:branched-subunit amino acid permease